MFNDITEADVGVLEVCTYARINSSGKQYLNFFVGKQLKLLDIKITILYWKKVMLKKE